MNTEVEKIVGQFERIFNKYQALRKQPIQYDKNIVLYRSELHMIEVVGNYKDINITKLANMLGITRGGASQGIDKLCKKQMVLKSPSPLTENEVVLTLTKMGKMVFESHNAYHKKMYEDFEMILDKYPKEIYRVLVNILTEFEGYLK